VEPKKVLNQGLDDLDSIYLAYGDDEYLLDQFISKFKQKFIEDQLNDFNYSILRDDKDLVGKIINAVETLPFMADRKIVIVHTYELFAKKTADIEQLYNLIDDFPDTTVFVFASHKKPDKRLKLYKKVKKNGQVLEFSAPKYKELDKWIKKNVQAEDCQITSGAIKLIEEAFSGDLQKLRNELEKAIIFVGEKQRITKSDIEAVISKDWLVGENIMFDFVDAIGRQNTSRALELLTDILEEGSSPKQILGMIARQVRLMIQTKLLAEKGWQVDKIAKKLNQHPYPIKKCLQQSKNFSVIGLEKALERLAEADYKLVTGADQEFELELLVIDLKEAV
jgi:DNA polymerase-3 subunit delta